MANQLHPQPLRAFDSNGDPVSGARLKFYIADTDTEVTVYSDAALTTPHDAAGILSDAAGNFAAAYYGGANDLKADATKDGSSLPGFPVPRVIQVLDSSSGASNISFTPVTGNANTDVQAAIAANTAAILVIQDEDENARKLLTSAGSSNAYTLTPGNAITAYAAGQVFTFVADRANTGAATLNVSGLGPKDWQKYDDAAALAALASGDVAQGRVFTVMYDGTRFVTVSAIVPDDDALANNGDGVARRDNVKAYVDTQVAAGQTVIAAGVLNGTGTPAWSLRNGFGATVTDNGTGDYTVAFDSAEADANYVVQISVLSGGAGVSNRDFAKVYSLGTSGFSIRVTDVNGTAVDRDGIHLTVHRLTWA